jgi:glutaredoxin
MYKMITAEGCPFCTKSAELMFRNDIFFKTESLNGNKILQDLMKRSGFTTVPQVWDSGGVHIGGYEDLVKHISGE